MEEIGKLALKYVGEHFSSATIGAVVFLAALLYAWNIYLSNVRLKEENESLKGIAKGILTNQPISAQTPAVPPQVPLRYEVPPLPPLKIHTDEEIAALLLDRRAALLNQSRKLRVLVADDEQVISNTLAIILNQAGYEGFAAYSGEQAADMIIKKKIDYLFSDVIMGGITGIDLKLYLEKSRLPVETLLFSGQAATVDLIQAYLREMGKNAELRIAAKPVHPTDLLAAMRKHFDEQRAAESAATPQATA